MAKRELTPEHKAKLAAGREAAKQAKQQQIEQGNLQVVHRMNPIDRAKADPTSLRKAIDHNCYECIYDAETSGTWREQVRKCSCLECPLYNVRPQ